MVQGVFNYPGISNPIEGDYTCAHGINPGRAVILAPAGGQNPNAVGNLTISYGTTQIVVRDMRLRSADNVSDERGDMIRFTFEDRRWAWEHGEVYLDDTPTSADVIARIFLDAMGEQNYDISAVPFDDQEYSSTEGEGRALNGNNPAFELQSLARKLSLRVVYDPLSDRVGVLGDGAGANLPVHQSLHSSTSSFSKEPVPSGIRVLGDLVRFQSYLELEAVGLDTDGKIKLIDDLSYKPSNGWESTTEGYGVLLGSEENHRLATESVFRWYRVKKTFGSPVDFNVDGLTATVEGRDDVHNLSTTLYENENGEGGTDTSGLRMSTQAWVEGEYWPLDHLESENISIANGDSDFRLPYSFSLDADEKLIRFPFQVFQLTDSTDEFTNGIRKKPKLWLYCSYNIRVPSPSYPSAKAMAVFSYFLPLSPDTSRVGPDVTRDPKLRYWVWEQKTAQPVSHAYASNLVEDDLLTKAVETATEYSRKYNIQPAAEATYNAILPVNLDGAIQSVTWSFDRDGAMTRVSRNTEPDFIITKHRERVLISEVRKKVEASL